MITRPFLALGFALLATWHGVSAHAQDLKAAEDAFAKGDNETVARLLLPFYRENQLRDGRAFYLLSRACFFQKTPAIKLPFIRHADSCHKESGRITLAAARTGDVEAMLDLAYTLYKPDRYTAHPDLQPDTAQAYRWALLAGSVANDVDQKKRATENVEKLWQALWHANGEPVMPVPVAVQAEALARQDFLRLARDPAMSLKPVDGEISEVSQFRRLGWVDIPGTDAFEFDKDGMDSLYMPTLQRDGDSIRFDANLNQADSWRIARIEARCGTSRARLLRDTGWQQSEGSDSADYRRVKPRAWKGDAKHRRIVIDFACAQPNTGMPPSRSARQP